MDYDTHRILADNACLKIDALLKKDELSDEEKVTLIDFAHTARLHYCFSGATKTEPAVHANLEKANKLVMEAYRKVGLDGTALWFENLTKEE